LKIAKKPVHQRVCIVVTRKLAVIVRGTAPNSAFKEANAPMDRTLKGRRTSLQRHRNNALSTR
jgi:hypothetical protein